MHSYVWHDAWTFTTWHIRMYDTMHAYVWHYNTLHMNIYYTTHTNARHGACTCVAWRIHIGHDALTCAIWLIHMCHMPQLHVLKMTQSYVWHYTFTCDMTRSHVWHKCDMTQSYVWRVPITCVPIIRVTWPNHMCDMPQSYVWRDAFTCATALFHTQTCSWKAGNTYTSLSAKWRDKKKTSKTSQNKNTAKRHAVHQLRYLHSKVVGGTKDKKRKHIHPQSWFWRSQ